MNLDAYLMDWTGLGIRDWFQKIEELIKKDIDPVPLEKPFLGAKMKMKKNTKWLKNLADDVWKRVTKSKMVTGDANITASAVLTLILSMWTNRIIRAKGYDPRRITNEYDQKCMQQHMYNWLTYKGYLFQTMVDESADHLFCPDQEWRSPFLPLNKPKKGKKGKS